MGNLLTLLLFILSINLAFAQTIVDDPLYKKLQTAVKIEAIKSKYGITGDVILNDMKPVDPLDEEQKLAKTCNPENVDGTEDEEESEKEMVLIFTGEYNPGGPPDVEVEHNRAYSVPAYVLNFDQYQDVLNQDGNKILELSGNLTNSEGGNPFAGFGTLLLYGASKLYTPEKANDHNFNKEVLGWMGDKIRDLNLNKDDQVALIASISNILYSNYDDDRNVTVNADNDPRNIATQAFGLFGENQKINSMGAVCDDIAFVGCELYQELNPDDDCLTMQSTTANGGQHFVTLLGNNGTRDYRIINGGTVAGATGAAYLDLDPSAHVGKAIGSTFRLNSIDKKTGAHKSIAIVKSEYGQWLDKIMDNEEKTGASIVGDLDGAIVQRLGAAFELQEKKIQKERELRIKAGVEQGQLSNANLVAVYALIDKKYKYSKVGVGLGYTYTDFRKKNTTIQGAPDTVIYNRSYSHAPTNIESKTKANRVHINPYYKVGNQHEFTKGNNKFTVHYSNGIYLNLMAGNASSVVAAERGITTITDNTTGDVASRINSPTKNTFKSFVFDWNMGLTQKFGVDYSNEKSGTDASVGVQLTEELGPRDWTRVHGLASDFAVAAKNLKFFLNRVEVAAKVNQKITDKVEVMAEGQYLGTNVGQNVLAQMGIKIDIPKGMQVFILTSYGAQLKGYQTKQNYLPVMNKPGVNVEGGVILKKGPLKGAKFGAGVNWHKVDGIGYGGEAIIPINIPNKKRKRKKN